MSSAAILTLCIFGLSIFLLASNIIDPAIVGLMIPTLLALFGIVSPNTVFSDLANTTVIFFSSLMILGAAIFQTGLADWIAEKVINLIGTKERQLQLGSGIVTALLSAFLNDTGTTGCMMPIVASMANKANVKVSKVFMGLAFFSSLGGSATLIGTTPHIVASGLLEEAGHGAFDFFEFAKIGVPLILMGLLYVWFFGDKLLPDRESDLDKIKEPPKRNTRRMILVSVIFLAVVVSMAMGISWLPFHLVACVGAILCMLTHCISFKDAENSLSIPTIFLVGGIFPLSSALSSTGAASAIISAIAPVMSKMPILAFIFFLVFFTSLLTQFLMNTSLTAMLTPFVIILCESLGVAPRGAVMAVAIASSAAIVTPVGTASNLLIWEPAGYKFGDYVKFGLPFSILYLLVTALGVFFIYYA